MTKREHGEEEKDSLSRLLESLGATSRCGYRLVDMLEDEWDEVDDDGCETP